MTTMQRKPRMQKFHGNQGLQGMTMIQKQPRKQKMHKMQRLRK